MKPGVAASLEDATGDRCVDLVVIGGRWAWVQCRRDPEDAHGWRRLYPPMGPFAEGATARPDAAERVGWLRAAGA